MIKSEEKLLFVEYFIQYGYFIQTYYMPAIFTKACPSLSIAIRDFLRGEMGC